MSHVHPPGRPAQVRLDRLPSDVLLATLGFLSPDDVRHVASTCQALRAVAISDAAWRPIVVRSLSPGPPPRSDNVTPLQHVPAPWDPSFGLISAGRGPAQRERWSAPAYGSQERSGMSDDADGVSLASFPGAQSYYRLYWTFLRPFAPLQGWWLGDVHSYGMAIRIVFDPRCKLNDGDVEPLYGPAFVCEKLHLVNRLYGMLPDVSAWTAASGFDLGLPISADGSSLELSPLSLDASVPGVKIETLWTASWHDSAARHVAPHGSVKSERKARIQWSGANMATESARPGEEESTSNGGRRTIFRRAHDLASQMVFGAMDGNRDPYEGMEDETDRDEEDMDEEPEEGWYEDEDVEDAADEVFGLGAWPLHVRDAFGNRNGQDARQGMRLPPVIQQHSAGHVHTVYLSSGAICTAPAVKNTGGSRNVQDDRVTLVVRPVKLYQSSAESSTRAFGLKLSNFLPLPPLEFPSPALLPLVRDLDSEGSGAFERFLDLGTGTNFATMQMQPCPPYLPWPHLSQPLPTGIRFVPIESPPRKLRMPTSRRVEEGNGTVRYEHPRSVPPTLDPSSGNFDWSGLNGLYSMTYGPWGQELIYIRSRVLTVHDFAPDDLYLSDVFQETLRAERIRLSRPTGPHGTGHVWHRDEPGAYGAQERLCEGLHWKAEPYVDVSDLEMPPDETRFIRPGCRVIEGVKCTGDANVPRGTVTFRAFSRGPDEDQTVAWYPPADDAARHAPWLGLHPLSSLSLSEANFASPAPLRNTAWMQEQTPGRVLDCATGRLASEGFVNAGTWRRCSVKITSVDQINVHWHALHKVAVAHRLYDC